MLVTGNPTRRNRFLWDGKDGDDVDIWAVLSRRYYGQYSDAAREARVDRHRPGSAGKMIWSSTYSGVGGTPGYSAAEPLSDPRMFLLWNALEGIQGTLYGQGVTSYTPGDPLDQPAASGEFVLVYPGADGPIASARLEQIRDGIEDWDILDVVRRKRGPAAVRAILGECRPVQRDRQGVKLACTVGCELDGRRAYSWPQWSHDASTAAKIEAAHLQALQAAAPSRGGAPLLDQLRRRDLGIRVLDDPGQLVPVEPAVEPDPEPAAMADVRRDEEPLGIRLDQHRLQPLRAPRTRSRSARRRGGLSAPSRTRACRGRRRSARRARAARSSPAARGRSARIRRGCAAVACVHAAHSLPFSA